MASLTKKFHRHNFSDTDVQDRLKIERDRSCRLRSISNYPSGLKALTELRNEKEFGEVALRESFGLIRAYRAQTKKSCSLHAHNMNINPPS